MARFDLDAVVSAVDSIARDNARETEGFKAAGGFDTIEGVTMVVTSADCIATSMSGEREWKDYARYISKPLTSKQAAAVVAKIRALYLG